MENYFNREFSPVEHDQDIWVDDNDYVGEHDGDDDGNNSDHDHFHYMEQEARREPGVFSSFVTTTMAAASSPSPTGSSGICEYSDELFSQTVLHMQQPELASGSGNSQLQALKNMSVGTILALNDQELAQKMERAKCSCRACRQPCKVDANMSQCASCLLDKFHPNIVVCPLLGECQAVRSRGESVRDDRQNRVLDHLHIVAHLGNAVVYDAECNAFLETASRASKPQMAIPGKDIREIFKETQSSSSSSSSSPSTSSTTTVTVSTVQSPVTTSSSSSMIVSTSSSSVQTSATVVTTTQQQQQTTTNPSNNNIMTQLT